MTRGRDEGPNAEEIREEDRRVRRAQLIVAAASHLLIQGGFGRAEGEAIVRAARARILELFPGREETYEILYGRRFARLLDEYTRAEPTGTRRAARILPFPPREGRS